MRSSKAHLGQFSGRVKEDKGRREAQPCQQLIATPHDQKRRHGILVESRHWPVNHHHCQSRCEPFSKRLGLWDSSALTLWSGQGMTRIPWGCKEDWKSSPKENVWNALAHWSSTWTWLLGFAGFAHLYASAPAVSPEYYPERAIIKLVLLLILWSTVNTMTQWSRELWQSVVGLGLCGGLISWKMRTSFSRTSVFGPERWNFRRWERIRRLVGNKMLCKIKEWVQGLRGTKCPHWRALASSEE